MTASPTIQSTAERLARALWDFRRARNGLPPANDTKWRFEWKRYEAHHVDFAGAALATLVPGDRCGPDGRYVVVDAGERERLAEFREMVAQQGDNARD